jgi:sporulation protein YlmC with PRC-barrel domain
MITVAAFLKGHRVMSGDGEVGKIEDVLFDADTWDVRYLVVDRPGQTEGTNALIPPLSIVNADWTKREVTVDPTFEATGASPPGDRGAPASVFRGDGTPDAPVHSASDVVGYEVGALDGRAGSVQDVMVDVERWRIPWFVVAIRRWLVARDVPVPAAEVDRISGAERRVYVGLPKKTIRKTTQVVV